jgi:hypothetical protein
VFLNIGYPDIIWNMAKVLVSINEALLARINRAAEARGLSRSAYLAQLAARDLELAVGPGRRGPVRESLLELDELFAAAPRGEAARELRAEREAHS